MTPQEFRTIRKNLGLTQAELARWLGYAHAVRVTEIETGRMGISHVLERLMRAYAAGYWPRPAHADTVKRKAPQAVS